MRWRGRKPGRRPSEITNVEASWRRDRIGGLNSRDRRAKPGCWEKRNNKEAIQAYRNEIRKRKRNDWKKNQKQGTAADAPIRRPFTVQGFSSRTLNPRKKTQRLHASGPGSMVTLRVGGCPANLLCVAKPPARHLGRVARSVCPPRWNGVAP